MFKLMKDFIKEEDGMGTVEIVVIIAVLVGLALIFRTSVIGFVKNALVKIFGEGNAAIDDTYKK